MARLKAPDGRNNLCGINLKRIRKNIGLSQRGIAKLMQVGGFDIDYHVIQGIESGERYMTDIELIALATVLNVEYTEFFRGVVNDRTHD